MKKHKYLSNFDCFLWFNILFGLLDYDCTQVIVKNNCEILGKILTYYGCYEWLWMVHCIYIYYYGMQMPQTQMNLCKIW